MVKAVLEQGVNVEEVRGWLAVIPVPSHHGAVGSTTIVDTVTRVHAQDM